MNKRGFTLIELLVVIAIIGLLSSVVLASLNHARAKARDSQRKQAIIQLRNALELYYADHKFYPSTNYTSEQPSWLASDSGTGFTFYEDGASYDANAPDNYIDGLTGKYISKLPLDPNPGQSTMSSVELDSERCVGKNRAFLYSSNGLDYKLISYCSMETDKISRYDSMADLQSCDSDYCAAFGVWTDGAANW